MQRICPPAVALGASLICGCGGLVETTPGASGGSSGGEVGVRDGSSAKGGNVGGMVSATGGRTIGPGCMPTEDGGTTPFGPRCGVTIAGVTVAKGVGCTPDDVQLCYKPCGVATCAFSSRTCTGGAYVQESTCLFPDGNYACFKVPAADAAGCPATPPQTHQPCSLALCNLPCAQDTACEMCGVAGGFLDASGTLRTGFCLCIPGSDGGGRFACGTLQHEWPCPMGWGC